LILLFLIVFFLNYLNFIILHSVSVDEA